jgi:natural product biosynthesis luciferase-like monooxygenase protein/non-ribosomal peptide synthase protein (TIGR01720 family)
MDTINTIVEELKKINARVSLEGENLKIDFKKGTTIHDDLKLLIRSNKEELMAYIREAKKEEMKAIPVVATQQGYKLSSSQRRLWVLSQFEEASVSYHLPGMYVFEGDLDQDALESAFTRLIARHEILRTVFRETEEGEILQYIQPPEASGFKLGWEDLTKEKDQDTLLKTVMNEEITKLFDLSAGPLFRAKLVKLKEDKWVFCYVMHHIISDGWSMEILMQELLRLYNAVITKSATALTALRIQYKDYAAWQQQELSGKQLEKHKNYWLEQFEGELPLLEMSTDKIRPAIKTYNGGVVNKTFNKKITQGLRSVSQKQGGTLFMSLLAAVNALLYKYTGQEDFILGTPIAGREHPDLQDQIGVFINTLALRSRFSGDDSFNELFAKIKTTTLKAYEHQVYPFDELVEALDLKRDVSRNALFDLMVVLQNTDVVRSKEKLQLGNVSVSTYNEAEELMSKFDLVFTFVESGDELNGSLTYNSDLYHNDTAVRIFGHLENLFKSIIADPAKPLKELEFIDKNERKLLLAGFNDTKLDYPEDKTLVDLFINKAREIPDDVALVCEEVELTYRQLHELSDRLAAYLRKEKGIQRNDLIALRLERSEWMLIAILGVLKSGAAYLPVDPEYPDDRIAYILEDSSSKMLLDARELDAFRKVEHTFGNKEVQPVNRPGDTAYVIYTSGSTGKPKGVIVQHKNAVSFFAGMNAVFGTEKGTLLSVTNYTFDISVLELIWTLTLGYKVVIQKNVRNIAGEEIKTKNKPLDFSLFYFGNSDSISSGEKYKLLIAGAKYADKNGYSAVWTPERHFHEFGGLYPSPSVLGAALATITERISIRAGSVVVPLHHPLRIAEEWSVIDNLSGGRVGIACASGWHADDFVLAPANYKKRHSVLFEQIDAIKKLWSGETVDFENGNGIVKSTKIYPKPIQEKLPLWVTSGGNVETFISAGRMGLNLLTHLLGETVEELAVKIEAYRKAYRENGHEGQGKVVLMLHTYIGDDMESTYDKARVPFINYLKSSLGLVKNLATGLGLDMDSDKFSQSDMDDLMEYSFNRYASSASLIGTKATCLEMLGKLSIVGVDEIACLVDFGIDYDSVIKSLDFVTEIKETYNSEIDYSNTEDHSISTQLKKNKVSHLQLTPSLAALLNEELSRHNSLTSVKTMLLGGEKLPLSLVKDLYAQQPQLAIYNMYGPTETTIWSACSKIERDAKKITIGKPIANTQIYILNSSMQLMPVGVAGEMYIGGAGVANKYINRPELSKERFIENPFQPGERLYRTGDFAKWLSDGTIEYIGRKDDQVKIRGYRIEPGEIESALQLNEMIEAAVVAVKDNAAGNKELVAYFVGKKEFTATELRTELMKQLPAYMLPSHFVQLPALPLTPNGKVNKLALPDPEGLAVDSGTEYMAPQNEIEEILIEIWAAVLAIDKQKISIKDNFFALGGDSIKSILIVSRLKQKGYSLKIQDLLLYPSIEETAARVKVASRVTDQSLVQGQVALSPIQSYFFEQDFSIRHHYNQSVLLSSKRSVSRESLTAALDKILQHHDALRMTFRRSGDTWIQENKGKEQSYSFEVIQDADEEAFAVNCERIQSGIDLENGPLFKAALFSNADGNDRLLLVCHHLVIDGVSWRILFEDLSTLYSQHQSNAPLQLPLKTDSFKYWQEKLAAYSKTQELIKEEIYWNAVEALPVEPLPMDHPGGSNFQKDSGEASIQLDKELTSRLLTKCYKAYQTEVNDILLAALGLALNKALGVDKILVKLEGHGRESIGGDEDITRTVGWFTSMYPVAFDLKYSSDAIRQLVEVKESLHRLPNKGIGYGVLRYLTKKEYKCEPQIMFNYLGDFGSGVDTKEGESLFAFSGDYHGRTLPENMEREFVLFASGLVSDGKMRLALEYSKKQYEEATIKKVINAYQDQLTKLINILAEEEKEHVTPVDLTYKGLSIEQLAELNKML